MSDYTKIVNYAAKDTLVEGDLNKIIKGTELDAEFVAIQTAVASKANLNSPVFTGVPRAPTASVGTNTTQVATTAFVIENSIPIGGIIMWSGLIANIPANWALCNGSNGTPDLRDKFVVGAGSTYQPSNTGGAATVTLVEANLPAHTHTFTTDAGGAHTHNVTDPGHSHGYANGTTTYNYLVDGNSGPAGYFGAQGTTGNSSSNITIANSATHTHTGTSASVGSGTTVNILPPYMALAYIMKTA